MLNRLYSFFFNRANQVRDSFVKKEQESPWRTTIFSVFYLFFLEIATSFLKFLILILKTPYESFQLFTNQYTLPVCQYSYFDHKKFQKKIRLFSLAGLSTVLSATIIINLVLSLILPGQIPSYAKTVYPTSNLWDDWTLSSSIIGDPTVASSPAASISVSPANSAAVSGTGVGSVIQENQSSYTVTDDGTLSTTGSATGGTFSAGTNTNTSVSGSGSGASVQLGIDTATIGGTGADGVLDLSGGCTGTGLSWASPICTINTVTKSTFNFTTINIPVGTTLTATGSNPLTIKATGAVTIDGTLSVTGGSGAYSTTANAAGGTGVAGGGNGGASGRPAANGSGTGGGIGGYYASSVGKPGGGGGYGGAGGNGANYTVGSYGSGGVANSGTAGSGGGGASYSASGYGGGGGAGGGSINLSSTGNVVVTGAVNANGGNGGGYSTSCVGGGGSGGKIVLSSILSITNSGSITANGGAATGGAAACSGGTNGSGGGGGGGLITLRDSDGVVTGGTITANGGAGFSTGGAGTITIAPTTHFQTGTFESAVINLGGKSNFSSLSSSQTSSGDSVVEAWGANPQGQLGDGTTTTRTTPVSVSGITNAVAVEEGVGSFGYSFSVALLSDGTVKSWGYNFNGQLGNGTTTDSLTPVSVSGITNAVAIAAGGSHALALLANGTIKAWGSNSNGELGDGTTTNSSTPVSVSGITNAVAIAAGEYYSLAILADGTIKAWGNNGKGQLGDGTTTNRTTPVSVSGITSANPAIALTTGYDTNNWASLVGPYSGAVLADGTVMMWGQNSYGQLGNGTTDLNSHSTPVAVSSLSNVVSISAGGGHVLVLLADGTIKGWGLNASGQLGNGNNTNQTTPVAVSGITNAVAISAGASHSLAILADGTLKAWGGNSSSQLGDGTTTSRNTPGTVANIPYTTAIAAGYAHSLATDGGIRFQVAANNDNLTWTYKNVPIQQGSMKKPLSTTFSLNGSQYFRYKALFSTDNTSYTPSLNDITISYNQYPSNAAVTNIKFNTSYSSVKWTQLSWTTNAVMTSAIKAKYRVRAASSEGGLTSASFVGNDGANTNASTYFDFYGTGQTNCSQATGKFGDTAGANATKQTTTCLISQSDATINAATNQWLEVEMNLVSDGSNTTQVDAIRATYSINSNPEVCATLLSSDATNQTCDGTVTTMSVTQSTSNVGHVTLNGNNIVYIRDTDTSTGTTAPGQVLVGLEYSDSAGNFSQATPPSSATSYYGAGNFASNFTLTPVSSSLTCTATGFTSAWKYLCTVNNNAAGGNSTDPRVFAGYTIDWNAKADFANMSSDAFKVRLLVNDQEGINPVNISAPATSVAFAIDTVNPTGTVIVDATAKATSNNSNAVVSCSDGSTAPNAPHYPCSYSMSTDDTTFDPWQSFTGASTTIRQTLTENASRESVLYFKLKDSYGNELPYDTGITGKKVITGQRPQNVAIQDVSNVRATPKSYKEFLSWEVVNAPTNGFASYDIYRCDSSVVGDSTCVNPLSYTKIASATPTGDRMVNYYTDSGLDTTLTYYYRIATKDLLGNISAWSTALSGIPDGTQNAGEGGGGGDVTPATISNIQIPSASITQNAAVITWTTSETANGGVFYGTSYGTEQSSLGYGTSHSISLSGLTPGTTYNIQLKSTDASGNQTICDGTSATSSSTNATNNTVTATNSATYCPPGATYSFTTSSVDTTPPVISAISSVVTSTWATITWTTNEAADTCIGSRDEATSSYTNEQCKSESVTSHSLTLSSLNPSSTYYIKVKSRDANSNLAQNCYANSDNASVTASDCPGTSLGALSFTTSAAVPTSTGGGGGGGGGKTDLDAPRISDIKVSDVGAVSATITWKTNEDSSSLVQSGTDKEKLKDTSGQIDSVSDHKVVLKNLSQGTKYYFRVVSIDAAGNIGSPDPESFTTKQEISAEELKGTAEEKKNTQQVLEDLKKQIQLQGDSINDPLQTLLESVSSLVPEPIIIGESPTVDETSTSAKISWRTDKNSNSFVALSRDDQYDSKADEPYKSVVGNPEDSVKDHTVNIENLLPATKYHFQVRSKAVLGEMSRSKDFSFTTKSELPEILKFLQKKTDNEKTATVYWQTSVPTDSVVRYTPYIKGVLTPKLSKIEGKPDMVADHEITITGLDPGTVYQMEISGRDPFGNQVSKTLPDFTTAIDKEPPVISQVRIESAMITGKTAKIQTIVSWRTDEPSTGQVFFSEGSATAAEKMKSTALDSSFTTIHTAVITEFNPASIYRIKIESTDESGNLATSRDFTILTPAQSQSIIDVIVKTFENTFGWVKNIKF